VPVPATLTESDISAGGLSGPQFRSILPVADIRYAAMRCVEIIDGTRSVLVRDAPTSLAATIQRIKDLAAQR
jgi:hypothetical protein